MKDAEDKDEVATCLREADEEVGLKANQVQIISFLHPRLNIRGILVTPIVGIVNGDFQPSPNSEVAIVFHLPLDRFLTSNNLLFHEREHQELPMQIPFFDDDVNGELITTWGLTALLCIELAVAVLQRETEYNFFTHSKLYPSDPFLLHRTYLELIDCRKVISNL